MCDVGWVREQGSWYQKSDVLERDPKPFLMREVGCRMWDVLSAMSYPTYLTLYLMCKVQ
jgi:hypothetical protein